MLTLKELREILETEAGQQLAERCKAANIEPIKGISFYKEMVERVNPIALEMQAEYHIQADVRVMITLIGPPDDTDESENAPGEGG